MNVSFAQNYELIVDQYWSPYSGAALNETAFHLYTYLDDTELPSSENKITLLWSLGRTGKLLFESVLSNYLMLVQHEVFGHGYRARSLGISGISYRIDLDGGATYVPPDQFSTLTYPKLASIDAAGMEATTILSEQVRKTWFKTGKIDRRDGMLFLINSFDEISYIYNNTGNDIIEYVGNVNSWYGNNVISEHSLRGKNTWNLFDPSLYYTYYSFFAYIYAGTPHTKMYMFEIKDYKYLPTPRLLLAPYGPEFQLQNHVVTSKNELWEINLRYGNTGGIQSYGLDLIIDPIFIYNEFEFGNKFYLWRQPMFLQQNYAQGISSKIGAAEFVSVMYKFEKQWAGFAELGYKTAGYIPGDPLGNSWVWRLGIQYDY